MFRTFFNYVVISYTLRDIKDDMKNLSMRKVVLYNWKCFNEY